MEMALGRQRVLVLRVLSRPTQPGYDGAIAEQVYARRELRRQLEREHIYRDQLAVNAVMTWRRTH